VPTLLPASANQRVWAHKRLNKDGSVALLGILNYSATVQTVTVNLENTGLSIPQTPIDLLPGGAAGPITSISHPISLPGYGFTVFAVS
jgi:hypothetical protein